MGAAVAIGLPASPGWRAGDRDLARRAVEAAEAGRTVILVRSETSPDDVHGMARAAGILTTAGGLASHAAVVARGWGIPAVVGAAGVVVGDGTVVAGGHYLSTGDVITIDGSTGEVFVGAVAGMAAVVPEAATLSVGTRAGDRRRVDPQPAPGSSAAPVASPATGAETTVDDALRILAVKGYATPEALGTALLVSSDDASGLLDRLVADGLAEMAAGAFRLTADGRAVAAERIARTPTLGPGPGRGALDLPRLDHRMKTTVTGGRCGR